MSELYPLRFGPIFRRYLWGGRKLGTMLNKPIGDGADYAESWELVDRDADQSRIAYGPLANTTVGELVRTHGPALLGRHHPQPRFPLLFKLLDCEKTLSVQVHPNDEQAAKLDPPDFGKTEAWIVLAAEPGSLIYAGLKRGFDRPALEREVARGTCELCLHRFEPKPSDCVFLPAGAIHALGAGLVIAEIQQSSDATFRLFDWNRVGADGRSRPLHVEQSLETIDYDLGPIHPQSPRGMANPNIQRLVDCDKFILDRWQFTDSQLLNNSWQIGGDDRFHLLAVVSGSVNVQGDLYGVPLESGQTILLPAALDACAVIPSDGTALLDIYLP
ncbi:MAG TPA: type I phosphomannose isomerase catalytic subunit [Pirellulales bacterium]